MRTNVAFLLLVLVCLIPAIGFADTVALVDQNAVVEIDPHSFIGVFRWSVDSTTQLFTQSFWIRTGDAGGERPLGSLPVTHAPFAGTRGLQALYTDPTLEVDARYLLTGGLPGSGVSSLFESVQIQNTSSATLDFHFFVFADFDLAGTEDDDEVVLINPALWLQIDPNAAAIAFAAPTPDRFEAAFFPDTLVHLLDDMPSTLNNETGPLGPADVTWAWQWDFSLEPRATFAIELDKEIFAPPIAVPAPAPLVVVGLGLGVAVFLRSWRRRRPHRPTGP